MQKIDIKSYKNFYIKTFKESFSALRKNIKFLWVPLFINIFYHLILQVVFSFIQIPSRMITGLLSLFVSSIFYALYLTCLSHINEHNKTIKLDRLFLEFQNYIGYCYSILIFFGMLQYVTLGLLPDAIATVIGLIFYVPLLLLFNMIPEIIYQKHKMFWDIFSESYQNIKTNAILWYAPLVVMSIPIFLIDNFYDNSSFMRFFDYISPSFAIDYDTNILSIFNAIIEFGLRESFSLNTVSFFLLRLFVVIYLFFIMIFRGVLYKHIDEGNLRRQFWRN